MNWWLVALLGWILCSFGAGLFVGAMIQLGNDERD